MYLSPHRVLNICIFISLLKNLNLEKNLNEQQQHFVCLGEIDSTMATDVQLVLGHIFLFLSRSCMKAQGKQYSEGAACFG